MAGESSFLPLFLARKATAMSSLLNALLTLLGVAGLGFLYRYHSKALGKAVARSDALAEVIRQRAKAEQAHTTRHEELDDVETHNDGLDLDALGDTIDAVFGDMSDDAGEGR